MSEAKKITVIQTTRIGDILQTLHAMKQLKTENPELEFGLVARKKFASGIIDIINSVCSEVFLIDLKGAVKSGAKDLNKIKQYTTTFVERVNAFEAQAVVNLSFDSTSSYLSTLIHAKSKLGIKRNEFDELSIEDRWSQYVYSNVLESTSNSFNLVDIYRFMLGGKRKVHPPEEVTTKKQHNIIIHPFASHEKKMWTSHRWSEFIHSILRSDEDLTVYIVGGKEDKPNSLKILENKSIHKYLGRVKNLTGEASVSKVYELLKDTKLLVAHDSMVAHLASFHATPSIILTLGTVRPFETTPFNRNVLNLYSNRGCFPCTLQEPCALRPCHNDISHQLVVKITKLILKGEEVDFERLKRDSSPFVFNGLKAFVNEFDDTTLVPVELLNDNYKLSDLKRDFYKIIWNFLFLEKEVTTPNPVLSKLDQEELYRQTQGIQYCYDLYGHSMTFCKNIMDELEKKKPNVETIKSNLGKLNEIDQLLMITKTQFSMLRPLIDYFYVAKSNAQGDDIDEIVKNNLLISYEARNLTQVLNELVDKTLGPVISKHNNA